MNSNLQEDIQRFLRTFDAHGPVCGGCWAGNVDFFLLNQARELLLRAVQEYRKNT